MKKLHDVDPIAGTIGRIFSITGGGPIPVLAYNSQEEDNPIVHEFWGFLGRRIARAALGIEDTKVTLADFETAIENNIEEIIGQERYGYLDTGFTSKLRSLVVHIVGYVTASNVDLSALPKGLINADDKLILSQFIEKSGPPKRWYINLVKRKRITNERTPIDKVLGPVLEALEFVPFIKS